MYLKHALSRVLLDASRWTPKGETNGLNTLYILFKKHINLTLGILFCFLCAQRVKNSIIYHNNRTEILVIFRIFGDKSNILHPR